MLSLDSPRWATLQHAYGDASDIPELLRQLPDFPPSDGNKEPWFTIWSSLAHQGDVYSASFAAVPHVVAALATDPVRASGAYFQFPAWVEIRRHRKGDPERSDASLNSCRSRVIERTLSERLRCHRVHARERHQILHRRVRTDDAGADLLLDRHR
jgi:hypothetical protein